MASRLKDARKILGRNIVRAMRERMSQRREEEDGVGVRRTVNGKDGRTLNYKAEQFGHTSKLCYAHQVKVRGRLASAPHALSRFE